MQQPVTGKFGRLEKDLFEMSMESAHSLVKKYGDTIDLVMFANAFGGEYSGETGLNNRISSALFDDPVPSIRIENTSSSGATAIHVARSLVDSGSAHSILIIGSEKMTSVNTRKSSAIIASLLDPLERSAGLTLPSLAGFLANMYMRKYGASRESIAQVSVKNHRNAIHNENAHHMKSVSLSNVLASKTIASPLRLFEFCPISDGSVSLLISGDEDAASMSGKGIRIAGSAMSSGLTQISMREDILRLEVIERSSSAAMEQAGIAPKDIDFAELHDMASILEIVEAEAIGLFPRGSAWKEVLDGSMDPDGIMPVNVSGGLLARGHPIAATGLAQAHEAYVQLTGSAGPRQLKDPHYGLSVNMAGFGNSATCIAYEAN
ncbi:Propanoyl-CoA C-acyltransferase [mine drainage metagenome]|uniref:propanoyl-CoA C-acyltransferase n=1 Tax=mine drainage metagenome TaxID=410659 RepID=T1DAX8_9ZZZZ